MILVIPYQFDSIKCSLIINTHILVFYYLYFAQKVWLIFQIFAKLTVIFIILSRWGSKIKTDGPDTLSLKQLKPIHRFYFFKIDKIRLLYWKYTKVYRLINIIMFVDCEDTDLLFFSTQNVTYHNVSCSEHLKYFFN